MSDFLLQHNVPVLLYTLQPTAVSRVTKNYSFTFDETNRVVYTVTGGATFHHYIWNYSHDHLLVVNTFLGVPIKVCAYFVDRRSTSSDHDLVLLTPLGVWTGLSALLYRSFISGQVLQRLNVCAPGGFLRLLTKSLDGVQISTGRVSQFLSTTIPAITDDAISGLARTSKYDLTLPQVQAMVPGERELSLPLLEYHKSLTSYKPDQVCPVSDAVRFYQFQPQNYQPDAKPVLQAFMSPLLHGSFCPTRTLANEQECIQARVLDPKQPELPITPFLLRCMTEFVTRFIDAPHTLNPTTYDEVLDRQPRPAQRRNFWSNLATAPKHIINMFLKAESYADIKPPRAISVIHPVDKREYSRFIYSLEVFLKKQPWYAFGLTPRDIAARVSSVLTFASYATNTDFSKFDGHGSNIMRTLERMILLRAFHPRNHDALIGLHNAQFNIEAYGTYGSWYLTHFSRASGSPETSVFNTIFNAFVAFLAARTIRVRGIFLNADEAFNKLGIYGGDDGLTADIPKINYTRAARMVGQDLTIEVVQRGSFGIKFLARVYSPQVWFGDTSNCCDLPRQLSKLHVTVNLPTNVTPLMKLMEKVRSYALTDPYTPILGDFCRDFLKTCGPVVSDPRTDSMKTWLSQFSMDNQYVNTSSQWMLDYVSIALPDFDNGRFRAWLSRCTKPEHYLTPPLCIAPKDPTTKQPVVVDNEVLPYNTILRKPFPTILDMDVPPLEPLPAPLQPTTSMLKRLNKFEKPKTKKPVKSALSPVPTIPDLDVKHLPAVEFVHTTDGLGDVVTDYVGLSFVRATHVTDIVVKDKPVTTKSKMVWKPKLPPSPPS